MSNPISGAPIGGTGSTKTPLAGRTVTWTSSVPGVCAAPANGTTDANGLVAPTLTMLAAGTTNLQATCEGKTSNIVVVVATAPAAVSTVTVSPTSLSGLVGSSGVLSAVVKDSLGNVLSGRTVTWSTSNAAVGGWSGGVGQTLTVSYLSAGTANVQAWCEGVGSNVVAVTVSASGAPVAAITVTPTSLSGTVGQSATLTAVCTDANGNTLVGRTVNWASSAPGVASVVSSGQATTVAYLAVGAASITAQSEGISATPVGVTVTAAVTGSGKGPNEPGGFSRIAEIAFSGSAGSSALVNGSYSSSGFGILAGKWGAFNSDPNNFLIATDNAAPVSPPACLQYVWPKGLACGSGNGELDAHFSVASVRQMYESSAFKIVEATFEDQAGQMKLLGYWAVGGVNAPNMYGIINGGTGSSFTLDIAQQGPVGRRMSANLAAAVIRTQTWYRFEMVCVCNTVDVANGTLDVWLNGTHTHHYTDVKYLVTGATTPFNMRLWNPIYGGSCAAGTVRQTKNTMLVDHIYISGIV